MSSNWERVSIGDICEKRNDFEEVDREASYEIVGVKRSGLGLAHKEAVRGDSMKFSKLLRLEPGDLVYRVITAFEAPVTVVPTQDAGKLVTPQTFPVFRVNDKRILPGFMALLTTHPSFHRAMAERCTGTVLRRKTLSVGAFQSIPVDLPPLAEQQRIVDLIDSLDDAIEAAEKQAAEADNLWWILAGRLEAEASGVPTVLLGDIADISGGITKNKKDFERDDLLEVPYLRVANVHRRYLDLSDVATIKTTFGKLEKLRLQPGDLVLNEGGDKDKLGRGAVWRGEIPDCIHQNHVFRARISDPEFAPEFVSSWANSFGQRWFETFGTQTTGIASISKSTLSKFPIPVLSNIRQTEWTETLEAAMCVHDDAKAVATSLRTLRSELLSVLLSGAHTIPVSYGRAEG